MITHELKTEVAVVVSASEKIHRLFQLVKKIASGVDSGKVGVEVDVEVVEGVGVPRLTVQVAQEILALLNSDEVVSLLRGDRIPLSIVGQDDEGEIEQGVVILDCAAASFEVNANLLRRALLPFVSED